MPHLTPVFNLLSHLRPQLALGVVWANYASWLFLAVIVLIGVGVGWSDFSRLRWSRIWALSSNTFTESIRRRVLLVAPLAILGVIAVVQLQRATDEQDAIRQTIKYTLFASGLLVTITALILASTSLPREIENRVIFTVVTKPTTRLEIVIGKVVGFARISGLILLLMGVFTFAYLELRNWRMIGSVKSELAAEPPDSARRATLQHYAQSGFLTTKSLELASDLHFYSRSPSPGDKLHWMRGGQGHYFLLGFDTTDEQRQALTELANEPAENNARILLIANVAIDRHVPTADEEKEIRQGNLRAEKPKAASRLLGPELPKPATTGPAPEAPAQIKIRILDSEHRQLVPSEEFDGNSSGITVNPQSSEQPSAVIPVSGTALQALAHTQRFFLEVGAVTPAVEFGVGTDPLVLLLGKDAAGKDVYVRPAGEHAEPEFFGRVGKRGMLLMGYPTGDRSVAVYSFHAIDAGAAKNGKIAFQLDAAVDKNGDFDPDTSALSQVAVDVVNRKTGKTSGTIKVTPELNRTTLFDVPEADVTGGDFDVFVRDLTPGQWLGLEKSSVALVAGDRSFVGNLSKSLLILWLLSTLVIVIAVFCSTFLSWPIAIVLSIFILFGHWGVEELGDALNIGVGRSVSSELGVSDPTTSRVVSSSVEGLTRFLKTVSVVLPDVSQFPVVEDIERGANIPAAKVGGALQVLLIYGIALIIGAYVILRYKEVAP